MKRIIRYAIIFLQVLLWSCPGIACSAFYLSDSINLVAAKNYDYGFGSGLIIVNKHGVRKTALNDDNPASWISRYGSITFNQYGREMPNGGMNEAGLVVEVLWLRNTRYPSVDHRYSINTLQWIQYQLDNHNSVDQVIASDTLLRISDIGSVQVHYFVCDNSGQTAIIEFLDGRMVCHTGTNLPVKAITNNTYDDSYKYLKRYQGYGGDLKISERDTTFEVFSREASLDRFLHLADCIDNYSASANESIIDYAFQTLRLVKSGDRTMWSIVYDIKSKTIYYYSNISLQHKTIEFSAFDFACGTPVLVIDINHPGEGDIESKFVPYTESMNYDIIKNAFTNTSFLQAISDDYIQSLAAYPSRLQCVE
jgi:choloylglycine hydrolase